MTQLQLDRAVARRTGESLRTIHRRGFGALAEGPRPTDPEDLRLVLDCPFCGHPVAYPGTARDGTPAPAECDRCDLYLDWRPEDVYVAAGPAAVGDAA
jgi:hypothetical protein